jgi:hypothetical protein
MRSWKVCERRIAEELGGRRVPVAGRARGDAPDVEHPTLSIEVKSRRRLPAWLENAVSQAEASAKPPQLPVAVLHQDGNRYRDALVVLRLKDFDKRLGCECAGLARVEDGSTKEPEPERGECL